MTIALISDIHANLAALEAVLEDIAAREIDATYCLGDVVGYGAEPSACLKLVREHCDIRLMGNHEYQVLGLVNDDYLSPVALKSSEWTRQQLSETELSEIADYAMEARVGDMYLVHASPYQPEQWHYVVSDDEAARAFKSFEERLCFYGHSHLPMIFSTSEDGVRQQVGHSFEPAEEKRYLVNVGSVGQPRDNDSRACYVTSDVDSGDVTYHRVEYDIERTQERMRKAGLPAMLVDRLKVGQ